MIVYTNDSRIVSWSGRKFYDDSPRVEVQVWPLEVTS